MGIPVSRERKGNTLKEVDQEKDLGVRPIISADLNCSQQCLYAYNKVTFTWP